MKKLFRNFDSLKNIVRIIWMVMRLKNQTIGLKNILKRAEHDLSFMHGLFATDMREAVTNEEVFFQIDNMKLLKEIEEVLKDV